jgi:hypothetical protein
VSGPVPAADPRLARCRPDPRKYAVLLVELALVLAVLHLYRLRDVIGASFQTAAVLGAGGFAVHYWLPLRWKEWFWIALSIAGAFVVLEPAVAGLIVLAAAAFFLLGRARWPWRWRAAAIVALAAALTAGRALGVAWIPANFWPVLGSVFLFRLVVWTYDLKHMKGPAPLKETLAYFLMLPNWGCLLFPVVDYHTQRKGFLARDHHLIAQQGVHWMARGLVQLLLYDWIYYNKPLADPAEIDSFWKLGAFVVATYLLYLRLSGTFHFVIGLLHLFGYDLPETHRKYLLASSLTDFWRRINIYWKDFMVKVVYFPLYFRWRRSGELKAQAAATALVFLTTWFLHALQTFWLTGTFLLRATDVAFWAILGLLVVVNLLLELRRKPAPRAATRAPPTARERLVHAAKVAVTFALIATLWSMWQSKSFAQWLDLMTWWQVGD